MGLVALRAIYHISCRKREYHEREESAVLYPIFRSCAMGCTVSWTGILFVTYALWRTVVTSLLFGLPLNSSPCFVINFSFLIFFSAFFVFSIYSIFHRVA